MRFRVARLRDGDVRLQYMSAIQSHTAPLLIPLQSCRACMHMTPRFSHVLSSRSLSLFCHARLTLYLEESNVLGRHCPMVDARVANPDRHPPCCVLRSARGPDTEFASVAFPL